MYVGGLVIFVFGDNELRWAWVIGTITPIFFSSGLIPFLVWRYKLDRNWIVLLGGAWMMFSALELLVLISIIRDLRRLL
jgi:hypothetical protein